MNEYGIHAQVLYPNLLAFSTRAFLELDAGRGHCLCTGL